MSDCVMTLLSTRYQKQALSKAKDAQPAVTYLMKLNCKNEIAVDKNRLSRKPAENVFATISQVLKFVFLNSAVVVCLSGP